MSLNQDNVDEIYSVENVQVKSSSEDKRFILKSKIQKILVTKIFTKTILVGTWQLHLKQITQKKYVLLKIWLKLLRGQDNCLQSRNLENVCGFEILTIAILAGTMQLYLKYKLRQNKASQYIALSNFCIFPMKLTSYYLFLFSFLFVKKEAEPLLQ